MSDHRELMREAIALEADAQRRLLDGDPEGGRAGLREAAGRYRASWEGAPPQAYGRLIGMLKAATIGGTGAEVAGYARAEVGEAPGSAAAAYVLALAALIDGDDETAARAAALMREGGEAFERTADALAALAARDAAAYGEALRAIVADFEAREQHLTGVPIADTALMLEVLASERGLEQGVQSALLPSLNG